MQIFDDADDYEVFLEIVRHGTREEGVDVHSYAVMNNHYHLQVTPKHGLALPRAMKRVNSDYSNYYNRKHRRTGTKQNPVRAGIVSRPGDYAWSSWRFHAFGEPVSWLVAHAVYLALGSSARARQEAYAAICSNALTENDLQLCSRTDTAARRRLIIPSLTVGSEAAALA